MNHPTVLYTANYLNSRRQVMSEREPKKSPMTKEDAARIQSRESQKTGGGATEWSKRAQGAADKNQDRGGQ